MELEGGSVSSPGPAPTQCRASLSMTSAYPLAATSRSHPKLPAVSLQGGVLSCRGSCFPLPGNGVRAEPGPWGNDLALGSDFTPCATGLRGGMYKQSRLECPLGEIYRVYFEMSLSHKHFISLFSQLYG